MATPTPVFYDCEASDFEGYPIEIGWAFADPTAGQIVSESHLIEPPEDWPVKESWDRAAEKLHGISLAHLRLEGRPVLEVAQRMNPALDGRELFSDAREDEAWLKLLFTTAGVEPTFRISKIDARVLISQAAAESGLDEAASACAKALAIEIAPRRHRAEPDARHLAALWNIVTRKTLLP